MNSDRFRVTKEKLYYLCVSHNPDDHKGYYKDFKEAQTIIIDSIFEIENEIILESAKKDKDNLKLRICKNQIAILKDFANSIAWFLFYANTTTLRAHAGAGPSSTYLKDCNLDSALELLKTIEADDDIFIMLTDITTAVNLGDILVAKRGAPPQVIELKEGVENFKLLPLIQDENALTEHLESLPEEKRVKTQKQAVRLKEQKRRLESLEEFIVDRSSRYDEVLKDKVEILTNNTETHSSYSGKIQGAYDSLSEGEQMILHMAGGLYVQVSKRPYNEQDILTFQHKIYHQVNKISQDACMINEQTTGFEEIEKEVSGIKKIKIHSGIQGIGGVGFTPATSSLGVFTDELATSLLTGRSMLYFYFDKNEFLDLASQSDISWKIKRSADRPSFTYSDNGFKARITVSWNFRDKMLINFVDPKQIIEEIKLGMKKVLDEIKKS